MAADKKKFYYRAEIFGEVEAVDQAQAEMIAQMGIHTSLRLQANETQDFNIQIGEFPFDRDEDEDDTPPQ